MNLFIDDLHKENFYKYLNKLHPIYRKSVEYQSMFFLLSSDSDIVRNIDDVFNFNLTEIELYSYAVHQWQTNRTLKTIWLAYNLFSNNKLMGDGTKNIGIYSVMELFDRDSYDLYMKAIGIRLGEIKIEEVEKNRAEGD